MIPLACLCLKELFPAQSTLEPYASFTATRIENVQKAEGKHVESLIAEHVSGKRVVPFFGSSTFLLTVSIHP